LVKPKSTGDNREGLGGHEVLNRTGLRATLVGVLGPNSISKKQRIKPSITFAAGFVTITSVTRATILGIRCVIQPDVRSRQIFELLNSSIKFFDYEVIAN